MTLSPLNFIISPRRRLIRGTLIILGVILVGLGLFHSADTTGNDHTLWIVDNSLSMAVTDIKTSSGIMISRLDLAKDLIVYGAQNIGGEHAIMSAAQGARLELPMTDNIATLTNIARGINKISRGGGSSVITPLETARLIYGNTPHLHIIWITDGEFSDSGSVLPRFQTDATIVFIGVGTRAGGPILLGYDADGHPKYRESEGVRVNSVRSDVILSSVSDALGARFISLESDTLPNLQALGVGGGRSHQSLSILMLLGACCLFAGLMLPRYLYLSHFSNGK